LGSSASEHTPREVVATHFGVRPHLQFLRTRTSEKNLLRTRVNNLEKLASLGAANPVPHVPSLDDEMVGGLPEANDDELDYLRAKEVRGVR
jgi:hypothetical protein